MNARVTTDTEEGSGSSWATVPWELEGARVDPAVPPHCLPRDSALSRETLYLELLERLLGLLRLPVLHEAKPHGQQRPWKREAGITLRGWWGGTQTGSTRAPCKGPGVPLALGFVSSLLHTPLRPPNTSAPGWPFITSHLEESAKEAI